MKSQSLRLEPDVKSEIEVLTAMYGMSQNALINMLIRQEYNKVEEDPKIKKACETMQELRKVFAELSEKISVLKEGVESV